MIPTHSTRLLSCLLCVPLAWCATPQDPAPAEEAPTEDPYFQSTLEETSEHGPTVITRNVLQDREGGFWFASWNGIVRFDGETFTNVTNQQELRRHRAFSLLEDREGNVWIGTIGAGVYRFDGEAYTQFTTEDGLVHDTVLSMHQDREGNLWFGGHGLSRFDGKTFTSFTEDDGFTNTDLCSISEAPDGALWLGTRGGLFRYDGESFVNMTAKLRVDVDENSYIPALVDREGHVWFCGSSGIYYYDGKGVRHLLKVPCFSLFEDSQGRIWFTGGALHGKEPKPGTTVLNRFDRAVDLGQLLSSSRQYLVGNPAVFGLTEDASGRIWLGTGRGVARLEGETVRFL